MVELRIAMLAYARRLTMSEKLYVCIASMINACSYYYLLLVNVIDGVLRGVVADDSRLWLSIVAIFRCWAIS